MQVSAETRWFWSEECPEELRRWFVASSGCFAFPSGGGGSPRTDIYLVQSEQGELGLKRRSSALEVEVKGLIAQSDPLAAPFDVSVELWGKWKSSGLSIPACLAVPVEKTRWLRTFACTERGVTELELNDNECPKRGELPDDGCNVEFTRVVVGEVVWWTFGLESFGDWKRITKNLERTAKHLAAVSFPGSVDGVALSYPAWLTREFGAAD